MKQIRFTQRAAAAAVTAALVSGGALAFAGSAAATQGGADNPLVVCANGNYDATVVFTDRGGFSTFSVTPGACESFAVGDGADVENVEVRGNAGPEDHSGFHVADGKFRASKGGTVSAQGTVEAPSATFPLL